MKKTIIGITGPLGSGKTTASELLRKKGFKSHSFSGYIKKVAQDQGLPTDNREILQNLGDELRKKNGTSFLAKKLFAEIKKSHDKLVIVDGIRNIGELVYIRKYGGIVIGVNSKLENRFERLSKRGGYYYKKTPEEFVRDERRDRGEDQKSYGQHAQECLEEADVVINNNGTLLEFKKKLLKFI